MLTILKDYFSKTLAFISEPLNFVIALMMSNLSEVFRYFIFKDVDFLSWLGVVLLLDTASGLYRSVKKNEFDFKKLLSLVFEKFFAYSILLILANSFDSIVIRGLHFDAFTAANDVICSGLFLRESYSILENLVSIRPELSDIFDTIKQKINLK